MALEGIVRGDTIRFLEILNERQAEEINFLRDQIRYLQRDKFKQDVEIKLDDYQPLGGFKSLRTKIQEQEQASRDEYNKLLDELKEEDASEN